MEVNYVLKRSYSVSNQLFLVLIFSLILLSSCNRRPDDALEPNDTPAQATAITVGVSIEARANQSNPDVFKIDVAENQTLTFELESLGLEECPKFILTGPNGVLYADALPTSCHRMVSPDIHEEDVDFEVIERFGYRLRTKAKVAGIYYLTIIEGSQADNIFPFSWDYRLKAIVE